MENLSNEEFIEFLESFRDDYFMPVTEISRAKTGKRYPLIYNDYLMFSLDDMCRKYELMRNNLPKTMDAIDYKITGDKLTLYLIEFKNFSIEGTDSTYQQVEAIHRQLVKKNNQTIDYYSDEKIISDNLLRNFETVKSHFVDSIEFDLRMKPLETIFVALPWLYDEYCKNEGNDQKDFKKFLQNIDIRIIVFINRYAPHKNISADRLSAHKIDNAIKSQYKRLSLAGIIADDDERILAKDQFTYFLKKENLS